MPCWRWPGFATRRLLLAYVATDYEVPTDALIAAAFAAGKRVFLPRLDGERMVFAEHRRGADAATGCATAFLEPLGDQLEEPGLLATAVAVAPLAGLGRRRRRGVGRGGGHYDRAFAGPARPQCLVGLGYTFQQCAACRAIRGTSGSTGWSRERGAVRCWTGDDPSPSERRAHSDNGIPVMALIAVGLAVGLAWLVDYVPAPTG